MKSKAFTLIEVIVVLVIIAIIALIAVPIVTTIIEKSEVSSYKRSVDSYGRSIELAIQSYELETGKRAKRIEDLTIEYKGSSVKCNVVKLRRNQSVFLSECYVDGNKVTDKNTYDKYYHYGLSDYDLVNNYGNTLEKQIKTYMVKNNNNTPDNLDDFENQYTKFVSCDVTVNFDGTVYLTRCSVSGVEVKDSSTDDGYYHYNRVKKAEYVMGDEVNYNGIDYYVIKDVKRDENIVHLLKKTVLTADEVNEYGTGHVNMYVTEKWSDYYQKSVNGEMAYYSSPTCGHIESEWPEYYEEPKPDYPYYDTIYDGCTNSYDKSDIKYVVDAWTRDNTKKKDLVKDSTGYSARLLTSEELTENLGYDLNDNERYWTMKPNRNGSTPYFLLRSHYWTMFLPNNQEYRVRRMTSNGDLNISNVFDTAGVRPVINVLKSSL